MDSMGPDYYRDESAAEAIAKTKESIEYIRKIDPEHKTVIPCITPRFAPACSSECLTGLGELLKETGYPCQTHISENVSEIELVGKLFPESASYANVYDDHGLLTDKTILAHAVHLSADEIDLVRKRNAKISHCPSSNTALTSGRMRVRNLMADGVDVGLGTDVSGGFSTSILEVARQAIWVSRHVAMPPAGETESSLTVEEVLYLATRGGAKVVNMTDKLGGFEVGKEWDAQLITLNPVDENSQTHLEEEGPVDIFGWEDTEDIVHKWVFGGDDRNVAAVWIAGRLVHFTNSFKQ
jgi:guanine deaminase